MVRKTGTGTDASTEKKTGADEKVKSGTGRKTKSGTGNKKTGTGAKKKTGAGTKSGTGEKKLTGMKRRYTMTLQTYEMRRKHIDEINGKTPAETPEEMDYNARHINHIMKIMEISQHADVKDIESLKSCFIAYLKLCQEDGFKIGNLAAYAALGLSDATISLWAKDTKRPEYREFALNVRRICSLAREGMIADQKINPVIGIFWQRNFDGLRNDTEQIQSLQEGEDNRLKSAEEYKKKYGDLPEE